MRYRPMRPSARQVAGALMSFATTHDAARRVSDYASRVLGVDLDRPRGQSGQGSGNRNRLRGLAAEGVWGGRGATSVLHSEGYRVVRSHDSQGAADLVAIRERDGAGPLVRCVQVKRVRAFRPDALNDAVRRFLGLGRWHRPWTVAEGATRECWLWVDGEGWAARLTIHASDRITATGPRADAVLGSVMRMLSRATRQGGHDDDVTRHTDITG